MSGLTQRVYSVLFRASDFLTAAQVKEGVPKSMHRSVDALLSQKFTAGKLVRRGTHNHYQYQLSDELRQEFQDHGVSLDVANSTPKHPTPQADRIVVDTIKGTDGLTLEEIVERCEKITRYQVVSTLNELVALNIVKREKLHGSAYYSMQDASAPAVDSVSTALSKVVPKPGLPVRVQEIELQIAELQGQLIKANAGASALYHASAARQSLHELKAFV
jgi:hypothetical protein